ncbi:MAG: polysaccharide biosynthesis tyrosine autokinase [Prochlorococcus marinus CUG1435]|nr:polysaccharide biosynthesis tyrosine autokinase [Prochlorococcus marinus CUG1435]
MDKKDLDFESNIDIADITRTLTRRKKLLGFTTLTVLSLSIFLTTLQRIFNPLYSASFTILIDDPIDSTKAKPAAGFGGSVFNQVAGNTTFNDIPTLIEFLKSDLILKSTADKYKIPKGLLRKRITIKTGGTKRREAEGVLKVTVLSGSKNKTKNIATSLQNEYINAALTQRNRRFSDGLKFLDKQAPILEKQTLELQEKLAKFRVDNSIIVPFEEVKKSKEFEANAKIKILDLKTQLSLLNETKEKIEKGELVTEGFNKIIGKDTSNPDGLNISNDKSKLYNEFRTELANKRAIYSPKSQIIKSLESRLRKISPEILREQLSAINLAKEFYTKELKRIEQELKEIQLENMRLPNFINEYEDIQQRLLISKENLTSLIETREQFKLKIAQESFPWLIISPAKASRNPVSPSVPRNLLIGLFLSIISGITAAFVRDKFNNVYSDYLEAERDLKIPNLVTLPYISNFEGIKEDKKLMLDTLNKDLEKDEESNLERFFYQEAMRSLYTSIRFLKTDKEINSITISSSIPGEGKSLINILLAKTLSDIGKKVLLIDCDLRKPQVHTRLGINNTSGLSNLLSLDVEDWRKNIRKVDKLANLSVLTAGLIPPDPIRLLNSQRMRDLVKEIKASKEFDLILFDTPPLMGLADAVYVSDLTDGLLLVVSIGFVNKDLPKEAIKQLNKKNIKPVGFISNIRREEKGLTKNQTNNYSYSYRAYGSAYASQNESVKDTKEVEKPYLLRKLSELITWLDE